MHWPSGQDYQEAIQSPSSAFRDVDLRAASVECDKLGLPRPRSGGFATVYKTVGAKAWAVRCFNRQIQDQQERYIAISSCLQQLKLPYTVDFSFLQDGIRVRGQWFPVLKMEWVTGEPMNVFIERNLHNPNALLKLAREWVNMANTLRSVGIAHGDLQHGNVLVTSTSLKLVDYDGMFVPALSGKLSNETGQPNYQLPMRGSTDFGPYLDNFSTWVVLVSLIALAHEPTLWQTFRGGDDCLLFRKRDFEAPDQSQLFEALSKSRESQIAALTNLLRTFLFLTCAAVPPLDSSLVSVFPAQKWIASTPDWVKDHVKEPSASPELERPQLAADWVLDFAGPAPVPFPIQGQLIWHRILLWASILTPACVRFLKLPVAALLQLVVAIFCFMLLRRAYRSQPAVDKFRDLKRAMGENSSQISKTESAIKQHSNRARIVREEEKKVKAGFNERRRKIEAEEQKTAEEARKKSETSTRPILDERRKIDQLEAGELSALHNSLGRKIAALKTSIGALQQNEITELANALKIKQDAFIRYVLESERIYDSAIAGIGAGFKARLHASGFHSAADIDYYKVQRVPGIGTKKAAALHAWKYSIENRAQSQMPKSLLPTESSAIAGKYSQTRQNLQTELVHDERKLQADELAITSRFAASKRKTDDQLKDAQAKLSKELIEIAARFRSRQEALAAEAEGSGKRADEQIVLVERQVTELTQGLAKLQWRQARMQREAKMHGNLNVFRFARFVAVGR